jgi:class 3 adenylate cyclase
VGRDEQLFALEDALLAAHRGESQLIALGAEAGMGKTRLASELAKRAQRLNWTVLWGACSEAELPIPYLPLVEALGNYLSSTQDLTALTDQLGGARRELAQLFPQLAQADEPATPVGDPAQAKLRLFEAIVGLLTLIAREHGLLLVLEDIHWADSATRELLDHLCRRLTSMRSVLLLTYRSDELDRRHPLAPLLQNWRRSSHADLINLRPLNRKEIAEMISAMLDNRRPDPDLTELMYARSEGNPFVLEEMLKEVVDRGELHSAVKSHQLRIPDTVRDTILLRFARLEPAEAEVLQAAALLGRTFDYPTLLATSGAPEQTVHRALERGVTQQLLEEVIEGYRWRHALTQEAISDQIVLPRRQQLHSRAADALQAAQAGSLVVARHLLGAGRFEEAVPACIAAAEEAEASLAFADALELLERALPHIRDPLIRSRALCRMGRLLWMDNKPAAAIEVLVEGVAGLERAGERFEAASYRLVLGRSYWEQARNEEAHAAFDSALEVLEQHGPSPELALALMRIATLYQFERDRRALETARRSVKVAEDAGADFERIWAKSFLAAALFDAGHYAESQVMLDEAFDEAQSRGYTIIARNIVYNDTWMRLHTMAPQLDGRLKAVASEPGPPVINQWIEIARTWKLRAEGELRSALAEIERSRASAVINTNEKIRWRTAVEQAEILLELGRLEQAAALLPPLSERVDLQDIIYDAVPQICLRLQTGRQQEAVELAREIAAHVPQLAPYNDALAAAVEALTAAGHTDEAQAIVDAGRARSADKGAAFLDEAQGRILLARGEPAKAVSLLEGAARTAADRNFRLVEWRARTLSAQALAQSGRPEEAKRELEPVVEAANKAGAVLIAQAALDAAERIGLKLDDQATPQPTQPRIEAAGERLITSMFADVRGYTALTASIAPADIHERITTLYRWAATEVGRHHGFVDKFAGDAVMATFNAGGTRVEHARDALEAALALSGKAALLDLGLGIGISVGPAVVGPAPADGNLTVLGSSTNLAARLQTAAQAGEIVLSDEAYRRVSDWLKEHGLEATPDKLELKGFDSPQPAWRLRANGAAA